MVKTRAYKKIKDISNFDKKIDKLIKQKKKRELNKNINITDESIINEFIRDFSIFREFNYHANRKKEKKLKCIISIKLMTSE